MMAEIPKLVLDPDNDDLIITRAYAAISSASEGAITDFSPGTAIAALIEGQVFAIAELLWFLNQLPEALALEAMRLTGISRSPGTTAKGRLTFLLTAPISSAFTVPQGFLVTYQTLSYVTTEVLYIAAGSLEGSVAIEAVDVGTNHNLPSFGIANTSLGLNYVQSVYNQEPISGGSDLESLSDTLERAQRAIRTKDTLVSATDFVEAAKALSGCFAYCVPRLAANKVSEAVGEVHVFLVNPNGTLPGSGTLSFVKSELQSKSFAGTSVWVSPVDLLSLSLEVVIKVTDISDDLSTQVLEALTAYLSPSNYQIGSTVILKELEFTTRSVEGVRYVDTLMINGEALNKPLTTKYTLPTIGLLTITQVDSLGRSKTYYLGSGFIDPD